VPALEMHCSIGAKADPIAIPDVSPIASIIFSGTSRRSFFGQLLNK
jgi:hypothetical protein